MEAWSLHMLALSQLGRRLFAEGGATARESLLRFQESGDVAGIILVLDDLAIEAVGLGDSRRGGTLWGAARHLQLSTGTALADYVEQNNQLFGVPTPKDIIAPDELERLSAAGAAMSLDEIVAYALGSPDAVPPGPQVEVA
jgi:hypothetical protein